MPCTTPAAATTSTSAAWTTTTTGGKRTTESTATADPADVHAKAAANTMDNGSPQQE